MPPRGQGGARAEQKGAAREQVERLFDPQRGQGNGHGP